VRTSFDLLACSLACSLARLLACWHTKGIIVIAGMPLIRCLLSVVSTRESQMLLEMRREQRKGGEQSLLLHRLPQLQDAGTVEARPVVSLFAVCTPNYSSHSLSECTPWKTSP
jgi:hypothetical protein